MVLFVRLISGSWVPWAVAEDHPLSGGVEVLRVQCRGAQGEGNAHVGLFSWNHHRNPLMMNVTEAN